MTNSEPVARENANIVEEQQQRLRKLLPEVFYQGKIDFDKSKLLVRGVG